MTTTIRIVTLLTDLFQRRLLPLIGVTMLVCFVRSANAAGIAKGPYLMNPTQNGITVCWVSDTSAVGTVMVTGVGTTAQDVTETEYHRVKVSGLKPHTHYSFTVACAGDTKEGGFTTAARPNQSFKFVAYGDNRTQPDMHAAVLKRMSLFKPDFIIQTGDQVADGENESQWDEFWQIAGSALSQTAYYPCLGNHERHGAPYFRYFAVPAEYSFDYGDAHFVALDSNRPEAEYAAQGEWLRKDLLAHQSAKWRIVFFHHTVYTCVDKPERRVESAARAKRLEPILLEGNVQLVINGHDHDYQRHFAHGITYIVTGGGGAPLYDVTPDTPFVKKTLKVHHHCELTVVGNTISVRAVEPDGTIIEQFTVSAHNAAP
jgi:hypothetical protein